MKTEEIIKEIQRLPIHQRFYVIERAIKSIRRQDDKKQLEKAADALYSDYKSDEELTAFTKIDFEEFYETR